MLKSTKRKFQIIIAISLLLNTVLVYKLLITTRPTHANKNQSEIFGFYVNGIVSRISLNANYTRETGYTAHVNDTVLIDHFFGVTRLPNDDTISRPINFLYEFNEIDSTFQLISSKLLGDETFEYIVNNSKTKLLFIRSQYPLNGKYEDYGSAVELRIQDSLGKLSASFQENEISDLFHLFISKQ